jgi:hypothetical protein
MFRHSGIVASLAIALAMSVEVARGLTCVSWGVAELPEEVAQSMVAGAFSYCEAAASANCVVCQPVTGCNLVKGGCQQVGGVDGCESVGQRRICRFTMNYFRSCTDDNDNTTSPCGIPMVYPRCVIEISHGVIISCTKPSPNNCAAGGTAQCRHCTEP